MYFKKIELENFRQFQGVQEIIFATDKQKKITLIDGENGAGKTTLLQAFNWCLFGDKDTDLDQIDKYIYNNESFLKLPEGESGVTAVTLTFEHDHVEYEARRAKTTKKNKGNREVSTGAFTASKKDASGIYSKCNTNEIQRIIPFELTKYFFFDGERMQHLNDSETKKQNLSLTFKEVFGLHLLESCQRYMKDVKKEFKSEYQNVDISKSTRLIEDINKCKKQNADNQKEIERGNSLINYNEKRIEEITNILSGFDPIKQKVKERTEKENELKNMEQNRKGQSSKYLKHFWEKGYKIFIGEVMNRNYEILDQSESVNMGVDGLTSKGIEEIITKGECICGNVVIHGSTEHESLIKLKKYLPPENLSGLLKVMKNNIKHNTDVAIEEEKVLNEIYESINFIDEQKRIKDNEIKDLDVEIRRLGEFNKNEVDQLESERAKLKSNNRLTIERIGQKNIVIKSTDKRINEYESDLKSLKANTKGNDRIDRKIKVCDDVIIELEKKYVIQEKKLHETLENTISKTLSEILNAQREVRIDKNYTFTVVDKYGTSLLSEGQKVVISFAIVKALIEICKAHNAKRSNDLKQAVELPLIMDAPLAKLDTTHRHNVIRAIPEFTDQLILFTTMSQLDSTSMEELQPYIGHKYKLDFNKHGKEVSITTIRKEL